jgi:hypothetical protein
MAYLSASGHSRRICVGWACGNAEGLRGGANGSVLCVAPDTQVMDQNRLDAMKELDELKIWAITSQEDAESPVDEAVHAMRQ